MAAPDEYRVQSRSQRWATACVVLAEVALIRQVGDLTIELEIGSQNSPKRHKKSTCDNR